MQGRHASFDVLDEALDLHSGLLGLYQTNADALTRAAPGGAWDSPELYAYARHIHSRLRALVEQGQAVCGALNTTATAAHRHSQWKEISRQ